MLISIGYRYRKSRCYFGSIEVNFGFCTSEAVQSTPQAPYRTTGGVGGVVCPPSGYGAEPRPL